MRRFFIILMIALLPLRSWAGDVMTLEMAVGQMTAVVQATPQTASDCHGQNAGLSNFGYETLNANETTESMVEAMDGSVADGRCDTCGTCQICHSVALADFSFSELPSLTAFSLLPRDSTGFASAPCALGLKPPIS